MNTTEEDFVARCYNRTDVSNISSKWPVLRMYTVKVPLQEGYIMANFHAALVNGLDSNGLTPSWRHSSIEAIMANDVTHIEFTDIDAMVAVWAMNKQVAIWVYSKSNDFEKLDALANYVAKSLKVGFEWLGK